MMRIITIEDMKKLSIDNHVNDLHAGLIILPDAYCLEASVANRTDISKLEFWYLYLPVRLNYTYTCRKEKAKILKLFLKCIPPKNCKNQWKLQD